MANSRFDYVRTFETDDRLLPNCWIVVRIDGKGFHKFATTHAYSKPNDARGLNLMSQAARIVMDEFLDIVLAYGQSDEYSFVVHKSSTLYNRRASKIASNINSLFTSAFCLNWQRWFVGAGEAIKYPPSFDARAVLYPSDQNLKDYLSWRQADVHINNLYNTAFWSLVQLGGLSNVDAERRLCGTFSADKNELLFGEFGINYNNEPAMFRKGTILVRKRCAVPELGAKERLLVVPLHRDMIQESFWSENPEILTKSAPPSHRIAEDEEGAKLSVELVRQQIERLKLRKKVVSE